MSDPNLGAPLDAERLPAILHRLEAAADELRQAAALIEGDPDGDVADNREARTLIVACSLCLRTAAHKLAGTPETLGEIFGLDYLVDSRGLLGARRLDLGIWIVVEPQTFNRARLAVSAEPSDDLDRALRFGYGDVWDYATAAEALAALQTFDGKGDPGGWTRHPRTGRRRQADGSVRVRTTDGLGTALVSLRDQVAAGAGHDCSEWIVERTGACALCDRPDVGAVELSAAETAAAAAAIISRRLDAVRNGEPCDLECGDRFYKGAALCRHNRTSTETIASVSGQFLRGRKFAKSIDDRPDERPRDSAGYPARSRP